MAIEMMEENIEIKDGASYEVLDRTPKWLMRWGVMSVCLTLFVLLGLVAIVPYHRRVNVPVRISGRSPGWVIAPVTGKVVSNRLKGREQVSNGDTILVLSVPEQAGFTYITAAETGYIYYVNNALFDITNVVKNDTLLKILPVLNDQDSLIALGIADEKMYKLLATVDKRPEVKLSTPDGKNIIIKTGTLHLSEIPNAINGHVLTIGVNGNDLKQLSPNGRIYQGMESKATITIKSGSMLTYMLNREK